MEIKEIIIEVMIPIIIAILGFLGGCTYTTIQIKKKNIQNGNVIVGNNNNLMNGEKDVKEMVEKN